MCITSWRIVKFYANKAQIMTPHVYCCIIGQILLTGPFVEGQMCIMESENVMKLLIKTSSMYENWLCLLSQAA